MSLLEDGGALLEEAVDLRRRLHRRPELGLELPETQATVMEALEALPLTTTVGSSTSSVVAVLEGDRPGPTILLRGDMDALPLHEDTGLDFASEVDGVMHACGHDMHTAMLAGAARLLADRRGDLAGRVLFMFQPGEEGHHGARFMLADGLLDAAGGVRPTAAFAIHQTPNAPSGMITCRAGALLASADVFEVTITGRGGHASMPHLALDPVPVACEIVVAIQTAITRQIDIFDPAVVTVGKIRAGTTNNVIPETATILGTIRTVSTKTRERVQEVLQRLAEGIAGAHGGSASVTFDRGYPVTVNHDEWATTALAVAEDVLGEGMALRMPAPVMGAEDFSYVLEEVPGAMAFLGTDPKLGGPAAPNHSNRMVIDETAMASGIAMYAAMALHHLQEPAPA